MVGKEEVPRIIGRRESPPYDQIIKIEMRIRFLCVERPHEGSHVFTFDGNEQIVTLRSFQNHL